jgi:LPXTG-motif cell wall-anchored protein
MSNRIPGGKATIAGAAIGSAAIAAALIFTTRRKKKVVPGQLPPIPSGENPETD